MSEPVRCAESQWLADELARQDKAALLRRKRTPRWLWPLVCALLAACVWPVLWRWYALSLFGVIVAKVMIAMIETGDAVKRERGQ